MFWGRLQCSWTCRRALSCSGPLSKMAAFISPSIGIRVVFPGLEYAASRIQIRLPRMEIPSLWWEMEDKIVSPLFWRGRSGLLPKNVIYLADSRGVYLTLWSACVLPRPPHSSHFAQHRSPTEGIGVMFCGCPASLGLFRLLSRKRAEE